RSNRGVGLQLFCVQSLEQLPRMFLPVTRQRDATNVLILECLLISNLRSATSPKNCFTQSLNLSFENDVDAARGNDESSTTNLSITSTSCDALQTAAQKSSTISEFICLLFTVRRLTLPARDKRLQPVEAPRNHAYRCPSIAITVFAISRVRSATVSLRADTDASVDFSLPAPGGI